MAVLKYACLVLNLCALALKQREDLEASVSALVAVTVMLLAKMKLFALNNSQI